MRWVTNDSIASLPLNTPFQMQTVRLFATSFFVAWDAHVGLDSAFLTVSDNTDTVMVRIMGGYHLPLPDLPITPYPEESDFDSVLVGTTICKEYHIHNASGGNITVTNFRIDGIFTPTGGSPHKETHFSIDASSPLPYTMLNNDSMSFTICYSPQAAGIDDDSLWIMNEDTLLGGVRFIGSSIAGSGVQRIADVDHVIIFPNPVRSHLYTSGIPEDGSYTIIDAIGREVIRETSHSNVIDVSNCHSGLYTIIFSSGRRANFIKLDP
ncbi:MAG TPA: T9SS type A sorting domain-containing protein [Candidatus Kapabacteria bacterium]|nr:T9SS type A sorting domain-containing protein [Candidatus Kapabacteria bacterium]